MKLRINEIFGPTIQGEGKTSGKEVMFLRLSGCNLHCIWCDTPYTWNWVGTDFDHPNKYDRSLEERNLDEMEIIAELRRLGGDEVKALVISGGEPLLQQRKLLPLLLTLKAMGWWIEIETNGTVLPTDEIFALADQLNCSPKLANSENEFKQRVRENAMNRLAQSTQTFFKFVVSSPDDVDEIREYVSTFSLDPERVYLMPLGMTRDELEVTREPTQALATELGLNFSDRLHVTMYGGKRGV